VWKLKIKMAYTRDPQHAHGQTGPLPFKHPVTQASSAGQQRGKRNVDFYEITNSFPRFLITGLQLATALVVVELGVLTLDGSVSK
jgi:hypothetical protein